MARRTSSNSERNRRPSPRGPLRIRELLQKLPARRRLARRILVLQETASTNDHARNLLADAGGERPSLDGWLVAAETQTAGRGRKARDWWSGPSGSNLAVSLILVPPTNPFEAMGILGACALAAALLPWTAARIGVKWPNDLLLDGAKVAGLLCEVPALAGPGRSPAGRPGETHQGAILGLGVNLLATPPSPTLPYPVTCLVDHARLPPDRTAILGRWILELEKRLAHFESRGPRDLELEFLGLLRAWAPVGVGPYPEDPALPSGPLV
ncbi:MAG: biotin--[acetyl-CoA-carboxylase] ligase, partial [Planctomycetota bacterium]